MESFTSLFILHSCKKLYQHYKTTRKAYIDSPALAFGSQKHLEFSTRIVEKKPINEFEAKILELSDDWVPEYHVTKGFYHGLLDLYSPSKNITIEFKTGAYVNEQLDFYAFLTGGKVYLYRNEKDLTLHEFDEERLKKFLNIDVNTSRTKISSVCSKCILAPACEVLNSEVEKGNIDAILWLADNYQARAEELKKRLPADEYESDYHVITIEESKQRRLKKGVKKLDVVNELVRMGRYDLLDFENSQVFEYLPDYFVETTQKRKKIIEKGEVEL